MQQKIEPKEFDFVSALAEKALKLPENRQPAGKAVEEALKAQSKAQAAGRKEFEKGKTSGKLTADKLFGMATEKDKEAGATAAEGARKLIDEYRSLKGFTYSDLLRAGGYDKEIEQERMPISEMITRISLATLPALAGYLVGGTQNSYAAAAGAAEAGMKSLQYMDQLQKEKRERAFKRHQLQAQAAREEMKDERRLMREAVLLPEKAKLEAQELTKQMQLAATKEAVGKFFEPRKETPEEAAARERVRAAYQLEAQEARIKSQKQKEQKKLGEPDLGGGFVMNPQKKWTAKDREKAQSVVSAYAEHDQAISELINTIQEVGRTGAIPFTEARERMNQATAKYIDSYRAWKGTGANYTAKEMQLAGETGIDPRSAISWDNIRLLQDPNTLVERLGILRESARKATQNKVGAYSAVDTAPNVPPTKQSAAPRLELTKELYDKMTDAQKSEFKKNPARQQEILRQVSGAK